MLTYWVIFCYSCGKHSHAMKEERVVELLYGLLAKCRCGGYTDAVPAGGLQAVGLGE